MKAELQAKFLQHLNQKKQDEGFTLIELLVVIIIIGILSAIALPAFLNQTAKAKQSEAKTNISSVNSAQTAYRTENPSFASSFDILALGTLKGSTTSSTNNYSYSLTGGQDTTTLLATANDTSLKGYSGGSNKYTNANNQSAITSVICEANAPGTTAPNAPTVNTSTNGVCPSSGFTQLQ